jgi:hypothetical protein
MADQTSGDAAPPAFETKNLPHGVAPAAVPYSDTTHIDRGETGTVEESPTPATESTGDEKKTTAARKSTSTSSKDS